MSTILVTGITGYLGSSIAKRLLNNEFTVLGLKRSSSDTSKIENLRGDLHLFDIDKINLSEVFANHQISAIIHTATVYGRKGESMNEIVNGNILFPIHLLELALQYKVPRFINTDSVLKKNVNSYSLSKNQFLEWLFMHKEAITIDNIRLEYFYGPGDANWKLITMLLTKLLNEDPFIELSSGIQKRRFIYIEDVIDLYMNILLNEPKEPFNNHFINTPQEISIKDLAYLCKEITRNKKTELQFGIKPDRVNDILELELSEEGSVWQMQTELEIGLKLTSEYLYKELKNEKC